QPGSAETACTPISVPVGKAWPAQAWALQQCWWHFRIACRKLAEGADRRWHALVRQPQFRTATLRELLGGLSWARRAALPASGKLRLQPFAAVIALPGMLRRFARHRTAVDDTKCGVLIAGIFKPDVRPALVDGQLARATL